MRINRRFTVLLLALGFLGTGWLMQSHSVAGDEKPTPKKKPKEGKEGKDLAIDGELTADDAKDTKRTEMYSKVFKYKMVKGNKYQIDLMSSDFDTWLRLENSKGKEIAEDDDGGEGTNSRLIYEATETGEFKLIVTTFTGGDTGKFKLTVKNLSAEDKKKEDKVKAAVIKLKDGKGSVTANLVAGDGKFMDKLQKTFEVTLEEGKTYQFDQMSGEFDSYLFLLGPDGKVLAEDDDTGGGANGLDSRIVFKAEKGGRYRLVASGYNGDETGQFTLTVTEK
jgi:Bacterial pre-peptidase C-terminal domain